MTRLGLGSFAVSWSIGVPGHPAPSVPLDACGVLSFAHELGLSLVQFGDNLPLHTLSDAMLSQVRDQAREQGIVLEMGMRGLLAPDVERYVELAQFFDARLLRVVVDKGDYEPDPAEIVAFVRERLPALEKANVTLAIENHDRFKVATLAEMMREIHHPRVGVCLDTVNSFGSLEGPQVVVETLGRYAVSLHVKEFVIRRVDHNMGFIITGAPTGQGMLNVPWLLEHLHREGRSVNPIIETWLAPTENMDDTAATEKAWVRESVRYLRTFIAE